jgi:hypothetical protein
MNVMAIIFGLCLSSGSTPDIRRSYAVDPQHVKSFCQVMAEPKLSQDKPMTLEAVAHVLYGGILLESDECKVPQVTVHFMEGYDKRSDAKALEALERFKRKARDTHLRGDDVKAERTIASVVLEGKLEKNPYYHAEIPRGDATLAAWDYNEEYAFVVTRVVSLRRLQ